MFFNENKNRPTDARKLVTLLEKERKQAIITINEISELSKDTYVLNAEEKVKNVSESIKHIKETIDRMLDVTSTTHGSLFDPIESIREAFDNGIWNVNSIYYDLILACYNPRSFGVDEDMKKVLASLRLDTDKIPEFENKIAELTSLKFHIQSFDEKALSKKKQ